MRTTSVAELLQQCREAAAAILICFVKRGWTALEWQFVMNLVGGRLKTLFCNCQKQTHLQGNQWIFCTAGAANRSFAHGETFSFMSQYIQRLDKTM